MNVELLSAMADQVWTVVQGKCRGESVELLFWTDQVWTMEGEYGGESDSNCCSGLTRCGR